MISQLTDTGDGQPPLVSVNIQRAKRLQDRRKAWARQKQHPSRASFTFQATRNVGAWNISQSLRYKAIWKVCETDAGRCQGTLPFNAAGLTKASFVHSL